MIQETRPLLPPAPDKHTHSSVVLGQSGTVQADDRCSLSACWVFMSLGSRTEWGGEWAFSVLPRPLLVASLSLTSIPGQIGPMGTQGWSGMMWVHMGAGQGCLAGQGKAGPPGWMHWWFRPEGSLLPEAQFGS